MKTSEVSYNLSGSVRHLGLPVAGVTIVLSEQWRLAAGTLRHVLGQQVTGAKGEFNFPVVPGVYSLEVIPDRSTRFLRVIKDDIRVTGSIAFNINLTTGAVVGGTVRTAHGARLSRCRIIAVSIDPPAYRVSELLDARDTFALTVPRGRYYLAARYEAVEANQMASPGDQAPFMTRHFDVVVVDNDLVHDVNLPDLLRFSGVVAGCDGQPLPGAAVVITPAITEEDLILVELRSRLVLTTDTSGQFTTLIQPGKYDLLLQPPADSPFAEVREKAIEVNKDKEQAYALPAGTRLSGKVTYSGKPVRGCLVKIRGAQGWTSTVSTGAQGEFSAGLPMGPYEVSVGGHPETGTRTANVCIAPWLRTVTLDGPREVDIELDDGVLVSGEVTDPAGKPRPGVRVSACLEEGLPAAHESRKVTAFGTTGDDGRFCLALNPGKYRLMINDQVAESQVVEVAGERLDMKLVWTGGYVVEFEIVNEDDEPVPRCKIIFEPYKHSDLAAPPKVEGRQPATVTGFAATDDNGRCRLILPPGVYSFKVQPPALSLCTARAIRQLSVAADVRRKVKLSVRQIENEQREAEASPGEAQAEGQLTLDMKV